MNSFFSRVAGALLAASILFSSSTFAQEGPGYLLVNATVTDFKKMGAYGQALPAVYAKYQGEYVIFGGIGRNVEVLTGTPKHQSLIFAQFESRDTVEKFWWSDDCICIK